MKKETIEKANAILEEIARLEKYQRPLESDRDNIHLHIEGKVEDGSWKRESFSHQYNTCPDFLKEEIETIITSAADAISLRITRKIQKLKKEFDNLKDE